MIKIELKIKWLKLN